MHHNGKFNEQQENYFLLGTTDTNSTSSSSHSGTQRTSLFVSGARGWVKLIQLQFLAMDKYHSAKCQLFFRDRLNHIRCCLDRLPSQWSRIQIHKHTLLSISSVFFSFNFPYHPKPVLCLDLHYWWAFRIERLMSVGLSSVDYADWQPDHWEASQHYC